MVGLSADSQADAASLKQRLKLPFPLLSDPTLKVINAWRLRQAGRRISVPATYVIAKGGRVTWRHLAGNIWSRPTGSKILAELAKHKSRVGGAAGGQRRPAL